LVKLIIEFADDEALFKIAMLSRGLRKILLADQSLRGKDRQLRIVKY